jgi:hypothetical protein
MVLRQEHDYTFTVHYVSGDMKLLLNFVVCTDLSVINGDAEKDGFHNMLN